MTALTMCGALTAQLLQYGVTRVAICRDAALALEGAQGAFGAPANLTVDFADIVALLSK